MIRTLLIVLAVLAAAVLIIALRGEPGSAELTWFNWNVRTTAAAAAMLTIFFTLAASLFWRGLIWVAEAPRRAARARADIRRRQGGEALTRGFLAAAGGDGAEARRQAQRAAALVDDTPALVRLLSAQAAEAADDPAGAKAAYTAMLGFPELRMAAHRGLMQAAAGRPRRGATPPRRSATRRPPMALPAPRPGPGGRCWRPSSPPATGRPPWR
ncbi:MAG: heme biosynthesis HemY N-terminal domain-containing protein [Caulobacteraceae bacterium]